MDVLQPEKKIRVTVYSFLLLTTVMQKVSLISLYQTHIKYLSMASMKYFSINSQDQNELAKDRVIWRAILLMSQSCRQKTHT